MLVAHIPGYTMVPGNPLSSYRQGSSTGTTRRGWATTCSSALLITPVDEVVFRDDGRPEIHFLRYPNLGGIDDLARFAQDLALRGFAGDTDWDAALATGTGVLLAPRREHAEPALTLPAYPPRDAPGDSRGGDAGRRRGATTLVV